MKSNRSVPPATVVPILVYPDVRAAVDWLADAFGFRERVRIGESHRAQLSIGADGAVIVGDVHGEQLPPESDRVTHIIRVRVDDVGRPPRCGRGTSAHMCSKDRSTVSTASATTPSRTSAATVGTSPSPSVMSLPRSSAARPSRRGRTRPDRRQHAGEGITALIHRCCSTQATASCSRWCPRRSRHDHAARSAALDRVRARRGRRVRLDEPIPLGGAGCAGRPRRTGLHGVAERHGGSSCRSRSRTARCSRLGGTALRHIDTPSRAARLGSTRDVTTRRPAPCSAATYCTQLGDVGTDWSTTTCSTQSAMAEDIFGATCLTRDHGADDPQARRPRRHHAGHDRTDRRTTGTPRPRCWHWPTAVRRAPARRGTDGLPSYSLARPRLRPPRSRTRRPIDAANGTSPHARRSSTRPGRSLGATVLAAISLRDLAAQVGLRQPSLYAYFDSKLRSTTRCSPTATAQLID